MASLALYRKYRPQSFAEVIGQEHVTEPLINALNNGKLHHAYLFSGPRGCGKTSSARILARSLNCVKGPTSDPCGDCDSCKALAPEGPGSLDVIEIDAASHGGVDDARELRERAFFAPVNSRYKIYVIDEAHMVSSAGFNALLKLVEEPPDFVTFIFATTEPDKVLQTIRSRTHHYPFRLIPPSVLRDHLEKLSKQEGVAVEPAVFPLVVQAAGGSVRDSLSILDQLLAGAGEEGVTYQRAVALLGVTDTALLDEACDALAAADGASLFRVVDRVVEAGHDPRRFASDLLERLRDLLIIDKVPDALSKGLIYAPADQLERMTGQALRLSGASLTRMADVVHDGLVQMRGTTSPRLVLELICARMLLPAIDDSAAALLQRLERVERRLDISAMPATVPSPRTEELVTVATEARESMSSPEGIKPDRPEERPSTPERATSQVDIADVRRLWPEILERLKRRRVVWSLMQNATPVAVRDGELVLDVQQGLVKRFTDEAVVSLVQQTLHDLLGVAWSLVAQCASSDSDSPVSTDPTETQAKNSYPTFDPDDGPIDNDEIAGIDEEISAKSTGGAGGGAESAAMALLEKTLGARKIAEVNN